MKFKGLLKNFPIFCIGAVLALVFIVITFIYGEYILGAFELVVFIFVVIFALINSNVISAKKHKMINKMFDNIDLLGEKNSDSTPFPVVVCKKSGEIIWFNSKFESEVAGSHSAAYSELTETLEEIGVDSVLDSTNGIVIECDKKFFNVFSHYSEKDKEQVAVLYFVDITKYRRIADEYVRSRPSVLILSIDNMTEIQQDYRESDCSAIRNGVEKKIEKWIVNYPCFITRVTDDKFYLVAEKQDVDDMISRKFDILDSVRSYVYKRKMVGVTLSIGVGNGSDLSESFNNAKLSLDMALGRGGDQAVVKTKDDYEFFGGISKSVESSNKVKSRVVASAITELIDGCDDVIIMGHRFPDFDAVGSAIGMAYIVKSLGKKAYIVTDGGRTMAKPLLDRAKEAGENDLFISYDEAEKVLSGRRSLLVVVDTHTKNFTEFPELLNKSKMIMVVDHHRKAVDFIDNAVIFFHDPSASSTSEMVTELVEYIPEVQELDSLTADGLMAGIILDTKNFIIRSTTRTFEAAGFLRGQNADTIRVKKLFANDIESSHARNKIISSAEKYKNCIVAVADSTIPNVRLVSSQAADELLNISGVDASFVLFRSEDTVCISARSLGAVNVQLVMEKLGGGGHQTMAAAQVKTKDVKTVVEKVLSSFDSINN